MGIDLENKAMASCKEHFVFFIHIKCKFRLCNKGLKATLFPKVDIFLVNDYMGN